MEGGEESHRVARRPGARQAPLPDALVEPTPVRMSARPVIVAAVSIAASLGLGTAAPAQEPIRIGASVSQTGAYGLLGQNLLRGYQLCVKHTNQKGGLLGRKVELIVEEDQSQTERGAG